MTLRGEFGDEVCGVAVAELRGEMGWACVP